MMMRYALLLLALQSQDWALAASSESAAEGGNEGIRRLASPDIVLNHKIVMLSEIAAELSNMAYDEDPSPAGFGYEPFSFYDAEPDQAIVAGTKDGYCFGAFRGTTLTWDDWSQNLKPGMADVCNDVEGEEKHCCSTRTGFYEAYDTEYKDKFEKALRDCAKKCTDIDECVVLTGHSQGGAVAAVAAAALADLNPYVITFGQPPTIVAPCELITSERFYRYVNTKASTVLNVGLTYDPVPFLPGYGANAFGQMILLSGTEDRVERGEEVLVKSSVAYIGLDAENYFGPLNVKGFEAHNIKAPEGVIYPGYLDRIRDIMADYEGPHHPRSYPVRSGGFLSGSLCTEDLECASGKCAQETTFAYKRCVGLMCNSDDDCKDRGSDSFNTGRCDSGVCMPKLGSCGSCDEDSDCMSGKCTWQYRCTNMEGLMDDECSCLWGPSCASGRCEGWTGRICQARMGLGAGCNEDSDCLSGTCSWGFRCVESRSGSSSSAALVPDSAVSRSVAEVAEGAVPASQAKAVPPPPAEPVKAAVPPPTLAPTKKPKKPTRSPTRSPTASPTMAPVKVTPAPTMSPTARPSAAPTEAPVAPEHETNAPTKAPVGSPEAASPTVSPGETGSSNETSAEAVEEEVQSFTDEVEENKKLLGGGGAGILILAVLLVVYNRWFKRDRQGYEEIPTQLNV